MSTRILIFDTTLRDGEQAPGCTMTRAEKLEVARQLARLGADIIEAGFPAASPGDWEAVQAVAGDVGTAGGPVICGLARANAPDIERCATAIAPAARRRIHTFIATSDIHLEHKLRLTRAQVLDAVATMVRHARSLCDDVEFSPEDASRSDPEFLYEVLSAAVESGASTLNIPDTVGYATPEEYGALIDGIRRRVIETNGRPVVLSTHCHDDLGLAVANSLAGVRAGARQVECTVNGIGERAGNASLEEVVMALRTRSAAYDVATGIETREIVRTSRLVASCTGVPVPPNKAIVGANAFAHEAGIHQDGVLKHRLTYEIMSAETVGLDGNLLVLGKHSGRHAFRKHLEAMGHHLTDDELRGAFARFKEIADRKKIVDERDIEAIVSGESRRPPRGWVLEEATVACGSKCAASASVRLRAPDGLGHSTSAHGSGPVDAVCRAINTIMDEDPLVIEFSVNAITEGLDAVGEVTMRLAERDGESAEASPEHPLIATGARRTRVHNGYGVHTDIVVAAGEAYVAALNKLVAGREECAAPTRSERDAAHDGRYIANTAVRQRPLETTGSLDPALPSP